MFNDFDQNTNDFVMSDSEIKSHKKVFSKICLSFLAYLFVSNVLSVALVFILHPIAPNLLDDPNFLLISSSIIQYVIGFPVLWLFIRKIPKCAPFPNKLGVKKFLKYALISSFVMYLGNFISTFLMVYIEQLLGGTPENSVDTILNNTNILLSVVIAGIIGPIFEELMFRKLVIDRLTPYGELTAILFPSLIFALFHSNLYQFFYAFFIGAIFSYIYLRTGKIIYTIALHIFVNLFFGILPTWLLTIPSFVTYLLIYELVYYGLISIGLIFLMRNIRNVVLNKGSVRFPKGVSADVIFFNIGTIALITICLISTAFNTFSI